jgi:hypothetical protein
LIFKNNRSRNDLPSREARQHRIHTTATSRAPDTAKIMVIPLIMKHGARSLWTIYLFAAIGQL